MDEERYQRQSLDAMERIAESLERIAKALQVPAEIEARLSGIEALCAELATNRLLKEEDA